MTMRNEGRTTSDIITSWRRCKVCKARTGWELVISRDGRPTGAMRCVCCESASIRRRGGIDGVMNIIRRSSHEDANALVAAHDKKS